MSRKLCYVVLTSSSDRETHSKHPNMSDSEKSPTGSANEGENIINLPPDPDAHLSESEKAKIVSFTRPFVIILPMHMANASL